MKRSGLLVCIVTLALSPAARAALVANGYLAFRRGQGSK